MNEFEQAVRAKLDEVAPNWERDGRVGADAAVTAIHRLALAAETDELGTLRHHIKNEGAVLRRVLLMTDLPESASVQLQAVLMRLMRCL